MGGGADSPGRWAPGCPRQSCSVCRCAGTSRPGHRSRGRAAPVQPSGGAAGSGMRAPASRHTNRRRALATSLLLRLFRHETDDRFCSCCGCCLPVMHTAAACATQHQVRLNDGRNYFRKRRGGTGLKLSQVIKRHEGLF